jgi:hypothetical protein
MTGASRILSIQDFLFGYVLGDGLDDVHDADDIDHRLTRLRAEVSRHEARTMTVVSRGSTKTMTRCRSCFGEDAWPCTALRVLAAPYARHPAYRSEWQVSPAEDELVGAEDGTDRGR